MESVTRVTRVMIARCQVATGQAAGAGVSRQPIIVMMMGRAAGGHLVHTHCCPLPLSCNAARNIVGSYANDI